MYGVAIRTGSPERINRLTPVDQLEARKQTLEIPGMPSSRQPKLKKVPNLKGDQSFLFQSRTIGSTDVRPL